MVLREWRARALVANADAYPQYFRTHVLPELRGIPGFLGACLGQHQVDAAIEFVVLTRWESMEAVARFAGPDAGQAVVLPGAAATLADFDTKVQHYQVIERAGP